MNGIIEPACCAWLGSAMLDDAMLLYDIALPNGAAVCMPAAIALLVGALTPVLMLLARTADECAAGTLASIAVGCGGGDGHDGGGSGGGSDCGASGGGGAVGGRGGGRGACCRN